MLLELGLRRENRKPAEPPALTRDLSWSIEQLESRTMLSNTPVAADFRPVDGYGLDQVYINGTRLLVNPGAGMSMLGSATTSDDVNNVSTDSGPRDGKMHQMNGRKDLTLPFTWTFRKDTADPSKLYFSASIGPSPHNFVTVTTSFTALDDVFSRFRFQNDLTIRRHDQSPIGYAPQYYRIWTNTGNSNWGEILGPNYSVRFTVLSSTRHMHLGFVGAPTLDEGVNNMEFSFGSVKKDESASFTGMIQTFRTDPAVFAQPALVFQAESQLAHQIGRRDGDGWSVRVGDAVNRYLSYGPYTTNVEAGNRTGTFRLMIDNNTASNTRIAVIDIYDANSGRVLARRDVYRRDFSAAGRYQDFNLGFTAQSGMKIEGRVLWLGGAYLKQDLLRIS